MAGTSSRHDARNFATPSIARPPWYRLCTAQKDGSAEHRVVQDRFDRVTWPPTARRPAADRRRSRTGNAKN